MAGHVEDLAKRIGAALQAGDELRELVEEIYAHPEIGTVTRHYELGGDGAVIFLPGWSPLGDPREYVKLSKEIR